MERKPLWQRSAIATLYVPRLKSHLKRHWFFYLVQTVGIILAIAWYRHLPAPGYSVAVLGVVAAVMSWHGDARGVHKLVWMTLMGIFLILEFQAIRKDRHDFATVEKNRQEQQDKEFKTLLDGFKSVTQQSHQQFVDTMAGIQNTLNATTGGDSFCYMIFPSDAIFADRGIPLFVNSGKYTLSNIEARIIDPVRFNERTTSHPTLTLQEFFQDSITVRIEELPSNSSQVNPNWNTALTNKDSQNFRVFFSARNGFWTEELALRRINGKYVEAVQVSRQYGKKMRIVFKKIDPQFPLNKAGRVDWPQ